ncbi:T9SS type A sorting domain-containing protein [Seonamhaeicola algicola]|uniref:T9SS type A sorting domain-containing protein n=1 Tax=Seonamhaeicola algicola TaxID=1719036 RepID=A0A5C7AQ69_9FLAO|nr:FG-GAP-like repeat-containing protein [Seonamhaeicola algicola]TXE10134.1 T9SS type A sorting domain-containing protein [Seonamhaeicola algicola]
MKNLALIILILYSNIAFSQVFKNIEQQAKLSNLGENNGVAVADYDGDKDLDLIVVAKSKDNKDSKSITRLFKNNNNGTFTDVTTEAGLINLYPESENSPEFSGIDGIKHGVSWGDYDNDGYPDLFFTHSYKVQLFHNQGDGSFIETTEQAGILKRNNCRNTSATWFDVNNDSYLDLYISEWGECENNLFYINNGNGTFSNATEQFGSQNLKFSYMSIPFDFNNDGWMDLYVNQDTGGDNDLFINNDGNNFTEQAINYGLNTANNNMGVAIFDYDNNGWFDFFVTTINLNVFFKNNGNNTFNKNLEYSNLKNTGWAWDLAFSDFDLDGDEDLFITNGFKEMAPNEKQENYYFENYNDNGTISFTDKSKETGLNKLSVSISATPFDYDNDGDLDLFVTNNNSPSNLYENKIIESSQENLNWFKLILEGTVSNRQAVGTIVTIKTNLNTQHRYSTGVRYLSQSIQPVHFGLGKATDIEEISIKWPSGIVETYNSLEINSTFKAIENQGIENYNVPTAIKKKGCTDPSSCNYDPDALIDDDSCQYLQNNEIIGSTDVGLFSTTTYSYNAKQNNTLIWEVYGGEIISGQNTNTINVKWHITNKGTVSVIESDMFCSTKKISLDIFPKISLTNEQFSIARIWNEVLLQAIRNDFARPTIHARNLFHCGIAMYDSWAIYNNTKTYLIGKNHNEQDFTEFIGLSKQEIEKTISYAMYRLINYRFKDSPKFNETKILIDMVMSQLNLDINYNSQNFNNGDAAALGNYIAQTIINYGNNDGSRENTNYSNAHYKPLNLPLSPRVSGSGILNNPNRWQPLSLNQFIDQSGNLISGNTPEFLSPEWGQVLPFSLNKDFQVNYTRDNNNYIVYHDPGAPPLLNINNEDVSSENYKWGFSLVSIWGAHLDPFDGVQWDISPKSIGNLNINNFPTDFSNYLNFYDEINGGDNSIGHSINPITGVPYETQIVPRGDYARVLAEFWADGPDSETPPGHWFTILNYVNDHPLFEKKLNGSGNILPPLEWDVKAYFLLGGTMHDAAIAAWSVKGWYDYIRPISAIRYMASQGQSSNNMLQNYNTAGIPLKPGYIELVEEGDELAGDTNEHIGKIKLYTWKGHNYIDDTNTDMAGVGWILAENWWPYQRPSFVTPPFAGYVSGHSTFSRAAAELMTLLTGSEFFPGGMGEFIARKNEFLVFEEGPSTDVKLQWATYRDASDQCSLSRIWGGIHPPADDIPGRLIGEKIGKDAYSFGVKYFEGKENNTSTPSNYKIYPNPISENFIINVTNTTLNDKFKLIDLKGSYLNIISKQFNENTNKTTLTLPYNLASGVYILKINQKSNLIIKP